MEICLLGATQSSRWRKQRKMTSLGRVKVSEVVRGVQRGTEPSLHRQNEACKSVGKE